MKIEGIDWNTLAISEMDKADFVNTHKGMLAHVADDKHKDKVLGLVYDRCCKEHPKEKGKPAPVNQKANKGTD